MHSKLRGECSYQAEADVHFPTLTTKETVTVSTRARAPHTLKSQGSLRAYIDNAVSSTLRNLGLEHTLDTKVGSDVIPGISGGERKRLSIAEVLACTSPLQCWDNSTRGLDSVNALQFIRTLRQETRIRNSAALVTLYQTSDDIYQVSVHNIMTFSTYIL
jgi:ATP-binding cassette, subfamily G (WHITE), member 2, PDR